MERNEDLKSPISLSLRRKKGDKFLQTAVLEYTKANQRDVDSFRIKNLMG